MVRPSTPTVGGGGRVGNEVLQQERTGDEALTSGGKWVILDRFTA